MDSARSWLQKLQQREKVSKKKEQGLNGVDESYEEEHSSATRQRVAAAKQYIENHYKEQMKNLQERKERYGFDTKGMLFFFFLIFFAFLNLFSCLLYDKLMQSF